MASPIYNYKHEDSSEVDAVLRTPIGMAYDLLMVEPELPEGIVVPPGEYYEPERFISARDIWSHTGSQVLRCIILLPDDRLVHQYNVTSYGSADRPSQYYKLSIVRAYIGDVGIGGRGQLPLSQDREDGRVVNESNDPIFCVDDRHLEVVRNITQLPKELLEMAFLGLGG